MEYDIFVRQLLWGKAGSAHRGELLQRGRCLGGRGVTFVGKRPVGVQDANPRELAHEGVKYVGVKASTPEQCKIMLCG